MKKILPLFLSALALTACSSSGSEASFEQLTMYKALSQMAKEENFILLDVRTMEEYNDGHIPGAINIANESIGKEEILQLPDKNQRIYVYCRSGNRSKQAAKKLVKLGYTNIIEIGGIIDYHGDVEIN
jgi:rhodanese-related sulfurtransferase